MDTVFFIASKLLGFMIQVENWLVLGLALGAIGAMFGWPRLARRAALSSLALVILIGAVPLHYPLLHWLETRHPAGQRAELTRLDGIVVLGGAELPRLSRHWGQPQLSGAAERLVEGAALAHAFPQARLVHTGGSGRLGDLGGDFLSEARVARSVYLSLGLERDRLVLEERSRNTFENARNARALLEPAPGEIWLLVTSAAHMPRAHASFRAAGWDDIRPWPVDYRSAGWHEALGWRLLGNMAQLNATLREAIGLAIYTRRARAPEDG